MVWQMEWVPRREENLKTIDQIHKEAEQEALQEQELIKHVVMHNVKPRDGGDKRRGVF